MWPMTWPMMWPRSPPGAGLPTNTYVTSMHPCTQDDLPGTCINLREGHRPKMFLWMIEEYVFILSHLRINDCDRQLVLGHELLLLACSRCCRKRGGGQGSCSAGQTPLDRLPACSLDTLECAVCSRNTIPLECLMWAMYDNVLGLGGITDAFQF